MSEILVVIKFSIQTKKKKGKKFESVALKLLQTHETTFNFFLLLIKPFIRKMTLFHFFLFQYLKVCIWFRHNIKKTNNISPKFSLQI